MDHGFVRASDGTVTTFDPSGSLYTIAYSINAKGSIAGSYVDSSEVGHGFVRAADGTFTVFDVSGSTGIAPESINVKGAIGGYYLDGSVAHGFLRK